MTHSSDLRGRALLLDQNQYSFRTVLLVTLDNFADRMALRRRRIFQMSALSTVDGTCYAYHGFYG